MKTRKKILKKSRRRGNLIIEIANFDFWMKAVLRKIAVEAELDVRVGLH